MHSEQDHSSLAHIYDRLPKKITRREFLGVGAGAAKVLYDHRDALFHSPPIDAYAEYDKGFSQVSKQRKDQIMGKEWRQYLDEYVIDEYGGNDENLCDLRFHLDDPTMIFFEVTTKKDPEISLPVFEVNESGSQDSTIFSVLQTTYQDQELIALGELPSGDHSFTFTRTPASEDVTSDTFVVKPFIPQSNSLFHTRLLAALPDFAMRNDTFIDYINSSLSKEDRRQALLTGMLFFQNGKLEEDASGRLRVTLINGTTDEDGGLGRNPVTLQASTAYKEGNTLIPGRFYDYDNSVVLTFTPEGLVEEVANQHDTLTKMHQYLPVTGHFDPPISPSDPLFAPYKDYRIVPNHGMTALGMSYDGGDSFVNHERIEITKRFSRIPDIDSGYIDSKETKELDRARRMVGVRVNLDRVNDFFAELNNTLDMFPVPGEQLAKMTEAKNALEAEQLRLMNLKP